ncbi:MAG: HAMP domain-containing protein [Firmicutes bacterium]|nr:HAMP domain-containing protein [Bacillota bacterium]
MIRLGTATRLALATALLTVLALFALGGATLWSLAQGSLQAAQRLAMDQARSAAAMASTPARAAQELSLDDPGMVAAATGTSLFLQVSDGNRIVQRSANLGRERLPLRPPAVRALRWGRIPLWGLNVPLARVDGQPVVVVRAAVLHDGHPSAAAVEAAVPLAGVLSALDLVGSGLVRVGLVVMLLSTGAILGITGAAFRRLRRLERQVWRIHSGVDLGRRLPLDGPQDEVRSLAQAFNQMLDRLESSFHRQEIVVAHASHQLRTPLAAALGYADLLRRWGHENPAIVREGVEAIRSQLETLRKRLDAVLRLSAQSGDPDVHLQGIHLASFIQEWAQAESPAVTVRPGPTLVLRADPDLLREALDTLRDNVRQHGGNGPEAEVSWRWEGGRSRVAIELRDHGPGFPPQVLKDPFRPFNPGPNSHGTGLGLSLVAAVARSHGGIAEVANATDGGAVVRIVLPVRES